MTSADALDTGFARLVRLAELRGLVGTVQSTSDGAPALQVGDSTFVRMLEPGIAVLQCPTDQKVLLMEISPDLYFETDHYVGHDAMLVRLDRISDEELSLRLHDAWMFRAPEKLKKSAP